jgi:hypothetical protein
VKKRREIRTGRLSKVSVKKTNLSVASYPTPTDKRDLWGKRGKGRVSGGGAHLLHSAQESSPRERFIWTSSGGMDFRIEEPLASELDRMTGCYGGGKKGEGVE